MYSISAAIVELIRKAIDRDYSGLELMAMGAAAAHYRYADSTGAMDVESSPRGRKISFRSKDDQIHLTGIYNAFVKVDKVKIAFEEGHVLLEVVR